MEIKMQEGNKVYITLADQTFLEITEYVSGPEYDPAIDKITVLHNRNHGASYGFEYDPRTKKLSEVSAFG
ncbi:MAG: hypothetical protein NT016_01300 [Candidatus Aenigmarchaeota archaeon]|nr:hypothetical protein [Candidatus Aenigmarchaeota archaeon]